MRKRDVFRRNRDMAFKQGKTFYEGTHCITCKGTKRYTSNSCCLCCTTENNRATRKMYQNKRGGAVYEKEYIPRLLKPWPSLLFEDVHPPALDGVPYKTIYHSPLGYASSAADMVEA